jgi:hypothetical protein
MQEGAENFSRKYQQDINYGSWYVIRKCESHQVEYKPEVTRTASTQPYFYVVVSSPNVGVR